MSSERSIWFGGYRAAFLFGTQFALGLIYLWAGLTKIRQPYDFLDSVYGYQLVGPKMGLAVASLMPWLEVALGFCLVGRILSAGGLLLSTILAGVFVFAQASAMHRGLAISCGCFGGAGLSATVGRQTLLRAIALAGLSLLAFLAHAYLQRRNLRESQAISPP